MKIILSAFACEPNTGSECFVGWSWAKLLAEDNDIHVITREYSRKDIETQSPIKNLKFHYYDLPYCKDKNHYWKFIKVYYIVWQLFAYFKVRSLNKREQFDIAHHITYNNIDVPGLLWLLKGPRFIWGSVGGGQIPPKTLTCVFSKKNYLSIFLEELLNLLAE